MMRGSVALCRHILRRDSFRILIWLVILGLFAVAIPLAFENIFSTEADRMGMAQTLQNPAMIALLGIGYGYDNYQIAQMMANEMLLFTMIVVAIGNILLVARHTRASEEAGQLELILALPVGRMAKLNATLIAALIFNILIIFEHTLLLTLINIESMTLIGNLYYALCIGLAGFFFACANAIFAQIARSSRTVIGISLIFFGLCYGIRALGDLGNETLSLISPLGLLLRSKPYVDENPLPLLIVLGTTLACAGIAFALQNNRDMGEGLIHQREGKSKADKCLLSPLGLAWRLNRNTLIAWALGLFALGAMYGSVFGDMDSFINSNEFLKAALSNSGTSFAEDFLAILMVIFALIASIPSVLMALKLRSDEKKHYLDNIASLSVSRAEMMLPHIVLSLLSCILMPFCASLGLWLATQAVMSDPFSFSMVLGASMSYVPAMLVVCGLAFALLGLVPRISSFVWALLLYSVFATYMAKLMKLDDWVSLATPFHYIKQLPVQEFEALPLVVLSGIAGMLFAVGYLGFHRRDLDV